MDKKKFKDTQVGKFLLSKIPDVVGAVAGNTAVGSVIQAIIGGSDMSDADKEIALKKLEIERAEIDGTTRRWVADARSGSSRISFRFYYRSFKHSYRRLLRFSWSRESIW